MDWNFRSDLPIYSQLVEQIKLGIVSGSFLPGERLASVRFFRIHHKRTNCLSYRNRAKALFNSGRRIIAFAT